MSTQTIDALHDVHTATNDVLTGYREMSARAQPEIQPVIHGLITLHERHAAEQRAELGRLGDTAKDDSSVQGAVNKAVVIMRDWVSNLDRDVLPAVRDGEKALRDKYDKALGEVDLSAQSPVVNLLKSQRDAIDGEIAALPRD